MPLRPLTPEERAELKGLRRSQREAASHVTRAKALLARQDFAAFVQELEDEAAGIGLPPGIPPQQTYFSVKDGTTVVGKVRFRPRLEPPFARYNGHIGYNIRPSQRRKGYATRQLALVLDEARKAGLAGVMIPIEGENRGSIRTVEKNGGRLVRQLNDPESGVVTLCYRIEL